MQTTTLPAWTTYGAGIRDRGTHALVFAFGNGLRVWFYHHLPIAFQVGERVYVRRNDIGMKAEQHFRSIDRDHFKARIAGDAFDAMLRARVESVASPIAPCRRASTCSEYVEA